MKIALLGSGSRGDIQPVVALGDALKQRGHDVRVTVNVNSAEWARRSGLEIIPRQPDSESYLQSPAGAKMLADGRTLPFFRELARLDQENNADIIRACHEACEGADLILSTLLTVYRGAVLEQRLDVPHACLSTMPAIPTAAFASYLTSVRDFRFGWINRLSWQAYSAAYWLGQKRVFNEARR